MKFKNICFIFLLVHLGNIFAMDVEPDRFSTPPRLRRGSSNRDINFGKYADLKASFRQAEQGLDYESANNFLDRIDDIRQDSCLNFGNPRLKRDIDNFLDSQEAKDFSNKYKIYKIESKKALNKVLVQGEGSKGKHLLPKEVIEIVGDYLCDK